MTAVRDPGIDHRNPGLFEAFQEHAEPAEVTAVLQPVRHTETSTLPEVVVRWTGNDLDERTRGDHALFIPYRHAEHQGQSAHGMGRAFPCSQQVPAPTEVERTVLMPAVGADGLPVTGPTTAEEPAVPSLPDVESTTVLPQVLGELRPALQGWSDIDEHLHRIDRDLAPLPGGWWWSCCDKTVTRGQRRDLDQVPVEQLCPRCWDLKALPAERRERQHQSAQTESSET